MSDFNKRLENATNAIRERVQHERDVAESEGRKQFELERACEARVIRAHGVAVRFTKKCVEPVMNQIRTKIRSGIGHEYSDREHAFAGWGLEFGETEYLAFKVHYDQKGVRLSVEARCRGKGIVYSKISNVFDSTEFDEKHRARISSSRRCLRW